jgi:hypothetical protein
MQARGAVVTAPAGFVVWVQGTKGPELQRWSERPQAVGSDYWSETSGRVLAIVTVPAHDVAQPLDYLAMKYPAPKSQRAKTTIAVDIRKVLECDP